MSAAAKSAGAASRAVAGKSASQVMAGIGAEQIAFLGEYEASTKDKQVFVQILCWPTVATAWPLLTQAAKALREQRGDTTMLSAPKGDPSWMHGVAPQLGLPLERDLGAAESTLATLIRRLPVRFAVAVVEHEAGQNQASDALRYRSLLSGCLTAYSNYLKSTKQTACRLVIAPNQDPLKNEMQQRVYHEVLPHLDSTSRLGPLELAFWSEATVPVPLEMAQLAAAAVGRHVQHPTPASPIFETIRAHLAPPSRFHSLSRPTRRK
ncbi:hypothetical protein [Dyella sp. RRB7]|uniref:hypothetical protein n=1 Tax=Dyella sp. RRB7 TaxID=2919502 RepID=UPI001FAB07F1|nr:hypothetical protein [Dyella sp. RRB7]